MVIKKYTSKDMNEALTRIRYELGKEAVIISQRKIKKPGIKGWFSSKMIEVTAAIENSSVDSKKKSERVPVQEKEISDSIDNLKRIMEKEIEAQKIKKKQMISEKREVIKNEEPTKKEEPIKNNKLEQEVLEMKKLLNQVIVNTNKEDSKEDELTVLLRELDIDMEHYEALKEKTGTENIKENLRKILQDEMKISTDNLKGNVVLVGPTGVGKTTTIAKLAGKLLLVEKKRVGLITVDTYRIGAVEQLKTYAEIMNIPFEVVITMNEMEKAVESMKNCDIVLIDTTGRSSKNTMQISELRAFVEKAKPDSINLVVSAITKNRDLKIILDGYKGLDYKDIIVTKLDETSVYGSLYNIQKLSEKPIRFITTGQNVPDDIKKPTKDELVRFILGEEILC